MTLQWGWPVTFWQAEQRKLIEKKLEEDAEREKKRYHQETQQLIEESQLEQAKITRLQQKMELVNEVRVSCVVVVTL